MKILLIDNSSLTPKEDKFFCELRTGKFAKELKDLNNDVKMFGQVVEKTNTVHAFDILKHGILVSCRSRKKNKIINYFLLYLFIIPEILKSDFIYIFYPSAFKYVALICWILRKPYGLYIRGQNDLQSKSSKFIYKRSSVIFTVADYFTKFVKSLVNHNNVNTIRPMIYLNERHIISNKKYKQNKNYKLLFLARMAKEKGVDELLIAVKEMNKNGYNFTLDLVGDGEYLPQVMQIIKKLKIEKIVNIKGAVLDPKDVKDLYIKSDIYILPTYHEGFPRTLYEAMVFSTPIITTFVGGISGVMQNKYNCLEIKPKSVSSIVNALEYAFENYPVMLTYAKNALETVKPIIDSSRPSHAEHLNMLINK